jgi:hypothetical protein
VIYFKEIDIDNLEIIQKKCLDYVKTQEMVYKKLKPASWYVLNLEELKASCPELQESFSKINLDINYVAAIVMMEEKDIRVHTDNWFQEARINIPLLNCENTFTKFYSNIKTQDLHNLSTGLVSKTVVNLDEIQYECGLELRKATVLRSNEGHHISVPSTNPAPRISLTIGFVQDPVYLLH